MLSPPHPCMNLVKLEIAPFDLPTPKQTWNGLDALFARYSPLNYTVTLKLAFWVTPGHRNQHYSIEHIQLYIYLL